MKTPRTFFLPFDIILFLIMEQMLKKQEEFLSVGISYNAMPSSRASFTIVTPCDNLLNPEFDS
ncbi:MAG: hypothetical protein L6243_06615 [Candidatus Altiarchaeales archaeon]|nr:hypothetical protein [Candidatus Altiarchaeota archaeon]MBU4265812.1 hypothetical protein [Candidatus Altiarchaeota archaeon]MBU4437626.1 hypothetical protein [Candidatus Altiarchaeota archaeon]MCG2783244.1 hypothetical protein [Candidatus Altiarchaeales archaeon]